MLFGLALLFFSACRTSKSQEVQTTDYLVWKQSGGMDESPSFELRLERSGKASYEGFQHTSLRGKWEALHPSTPLEEIWALVDSLDVAKLPPYFPSSVQDAPNRSLTFSLQNQTKEVNYRTDPPDSIQELELLLRQLIRDAKWQASNR